MSKAVFNGNYNKDRMIPSLTNFQFPSICHHTLHPTPAQYLMHIYHLAVLVCFLLLQDSYCDITLNQTMAHHHPVPLYLVVSFNSAFAQT